MVLVASFTYVAVKLESFYEVMPFVVAEVQTVHLVEILLAREVLTMIMEHPLDVVIVVGIG